MKIDFKRLTGSYRSGDGLITMSVSDCSAPGGMLVGRQFAKIKVTGVKSTVLRFPS